MKECPFKYKQEIWETNSIVNYDCEEPKKTGEYFACKLINASLTDDECVGESKCPIMKK